MRLDTEWPLPSLHQSCDSGERNRVIKKHLLTFARVKISERYWLIGVIIDRLGSLRVGHVRSSDAEQDRARGKEWSPKSVEGNSRTSCGELEGNSKRYQNGC